MEQQKIRRLSVPVPRTGLGPPPDAITEICKRYPTISFQGLELFGRPCDRYVIADDNTPLKVLRNAVEDYCFAATIRLPVENTTSRFENFVATTEEQHEALRLARTFAQLPTGQTAGLYLEGKFGVGKTHLATAVAKTWYVAEHKFDFIYGPSSNASFLERRVVFDDIDQGQAALAELRSSLERFADSGGSHVLVTANQSLPNLLLHAYKGDKLKTDRLYDRLRTAFHLVDMVGPAARTDAAWGKQ